MSSKHLRRYLGDTLKKLDDETQSLSEEEKSDGEVKLDNKFAFLEELAEDHSEGKPEQVVVVEKKESVKKVSKKKKRKNEKKAGKKSDDVDDEALFLKAVEPTRIEPSSSPRSFLFEQDLFKVETRWLNGEAELRKLLGLRGHEPQKHSQKRKFGKIMKKKDNWPQLKNIGLSMKIDREESGITWFNFVHNGSYQLYQQSFWVHIGTLNHAGVGELLRECPYHLDSLLIMAEAMRHQEDYQVSRDLIERGIYCCESVFSPRFELSNHNHRISYAQFENRAFYLLLHQHMRNLADRSFFISALNVAKLIYRLDPLDDPLAITLTIDTLALKAKEVNYLLQLYDTLKDSRSLERLPSFSYSFALAHFLLFCENGEEGELQKANELLATAIYHYPTVIVQLLNKLNVQPDSEIENNVYMNTLAHEKESEGFKYLTDCYIGLSHDLWKEPEVLSWLERATRAAVADFDNHTTELQRWAEIRKTYVGIPQNVQRHAFLWNVKQSADWTLVDPAPPFASSSTYSRNVRQMPASRFPFLRLITTVLPEEHQLDHLYEQMMDVMRHLFPTNNTANTAPRQDPPQ